jgi:hypothetical protein
MRTFGKPCASSKGLRTFEAGLAPHPVPLKRKVAQPRASASILLFGFDLREVHCFIHRRRWGGGPPSLRRRRRADLAVACPYGSAIGTDSERPARMKIKKSHALDLARLRISEIYSLSLYRISIVTNVIISADAHSFKIKSFLAHRWKTQTLRIRGAAPTALRGRANPFDVRRHAHAEPWAWHAEKK